MQQNFMQFSKVTIVRAKCKVNKKSGLTDEAQIIYPCTNTGFHPSFTKFKMIHLMGQTKLPF